MKRVCVLELSKHNPIMHLWLKMIMIYSLAYSITTWHSGWKSPKIAHESWVILMYNTLYNVEHYKGEGGINSWPNKKQTWCCHSWSHQEVPRETFKIDLAEKRSWRRDGGACLDPQKPRSCFLVKLVQLSRLSNYSHQIFAWCQSHSISFARNPHQLSLSDFLSVHNPFRARECLRGQGSDTLSSSKKTFICMHF